MTHYIRPQVPFIEQVEKPEQESYLGSANDPREALIAMRKAKYHIASE